MDIRGPDRAQQRSLLFGSTAPLLTALSWASDWAGFPPSSSHCWLSWRRSFMVVGSGSGSICDLPSFRRSSRVIGLHRRIRRHHRNRNDLVVACRDQQVLKLDRLAPLILSREHCQAQQNAAIDHTTFSLFRRTCSDHWPAVGHFDGGW